jgi:hypothetical protein
VCHFLRRAQKMAHKRISLLVVEGSMLAGRVAASVFQRQTTPAEWPGSSRVLISCAGALAETAVDRAVHAADLAAKDGQNSDDDNHNQH